MNCFCKTTASARLWLYLKRLYFKCSRLLHFAVCQLLCWASLSSYVASRSFPFLIDGIPSSILPSLAVSQRLFLRPIFFMYTTQLSTLITQSSVSSHLYADDTQLFISFISMNFTIAISHLEAIMASISSWMTANLLTINSSKTEFC